MGSIKATNKRLRQALVEGSCNVVVDGIAGMYVNEPDKEMVKFSGRKGFIRAAVETGTPIVPAFNFGNSRLLTLVPKFLEKPARKLQCAMGIIVGRWGLPFQEGDDHDGCGKGHRGGEDGPERPALCGVRGRGAAEGGGRVAESVL